jgi:2-polyprenyl-6-methoxyphenol hydroxylase-like FAD-dependent oxidoreductase
VKWRYRVVDIGQNEAQAWVFVETPTGRQRYEADYVIGYDGANSQIRRSLFGDLNFPGEALNA